MNDSVTKDTSGKSAARTAHLIIPGMGSDHCAGIISTSLKRLDGVSEVRANIAIAAIPVAAVGLPHPMIGVVAMTASSLSVIGNSLLLKRARLEVRKS